MRALILSYSNMKEKEAVGQMKYRQAPWIFPC